MKFLFVFLFSLLLLLLPAMPDLPGSVRSQASLMAFAAPQTAVFHLGNDEAIHRLPGSARPALRTLFCETGHACLAIRALVAVAIIITGRQFRPDPSASRYFPLRL